MNRKERKRLRREEREEQERLARIAAATPPVQHETLEEANAALSEAARIINMKEAAEKSKARKKTEAESKAAATSNGAATTKPRKAAGPKLPPLPRLKSAKAKPDLPCMCGCGGTTKRKFMPGHDSYLRGLVMRVEREMMTVKDIEETVGKGQAEAVRREIAERKKAAKAEGKAEKPAKAVKTAATAKSDEIEATGTEK